MQRGWSFGSAPLRRRPYSHFVPPTIETDHFARLFREWNRLRPRTRPKDQSMSDTSQQCERNSYALHRSVGRIPADPSAPLGRLVRIRHQRARHPHWLNDTQIAALMATTHTDRLVDRRDRIVLLLGLLTGLRTGEIAGSAGPTSTCQPACCASSAKATNRQPSPCPPNSSTNSPAGVNSSDRTSPPSCPTDRSCARCAARSAPTPTMRHPCCSPRPSEPTAWPASSTTVGCYRRPGPTTT